MEDEKIRNDLIAWGDVQVVQVRGLTRGGSPADAARTLHADRSGPEVGVAGSQDVQRGEELAYVEVESTPSSGC